MSKKQKGNKVVCPAPIGDNVNHPKHYNSHPSGIECISVVRHYNFNVGNVIKYLWRHGLKHEQGMDDKAKALEDLRKARFYLDDEIKRMEEQIWLSDTEVCRNAAIKAGLDVKTLKTVFKKMAQEITGLKK